MLIFTPPLFQNIIIRESPVYCPCFLDHPQIYFASFSCFRHSSRTSSPISHFSLLLMLPLRDPLRSSLLSPFSHRLLLYSLYFFLCPPVRGLSHTLPCHPFSLARNSCANSTGSATTRFASSSYRTSVYPVNGKSFRLGCPSNP
jgi:hypothetical protein